MVTNKVFWSRAPLRLGLAGGGTDVSPYSELYGGYILNSTINLFAYANIEPMDSGKIIFEAIDRGIKQTYDSEEHIETSGELSLLKGVYNKIVKDYTGMPLSFKLTTFVDAPPGSGLGSSSTLVVAIMGVFSEWLEIPLGEYEIAQEAFNVERIDLNMSGGKQDQYAATFGGFNFMEFLPDDKVVVNPLRIKNHVIRDLEINLLLYNLESSRISSQIIDKMKYNVKSSKKENIEAMHIVKDQALNMKESLIKGNLGDFAEIMREGWKAKKEMAEGITSPLIDEVYSVALKSGAVAGRVSGAGGGGFMLLYCPDNSKYKVIKGLEPYSGYFQKYQFIRQGLITWSV